jgi:hypothetical protein
MDEDTVAEAEASEADDAGFVPASSVASGDDADGDQSRLGDF